MEIQQKGDFAEGPSRKGSGSGEPPTQPIASFRLPQGTTLSIHLTDRPWELPADALVVPFDTLWNPGGLWHALREALPKEAVEILSHIDKQRESPLTSSQPRVICDTGDLSAAHDLPRLLIAASPFDDPEAKATPQAAAQASGEAVHVADEHGLESVILPILGAGEAGLDPESALKEILAGLQASTHRSISSILLADHRSGIAELARGHAEGMFAPARSSPASPDLRPAYISDLETPRDSLRIRSHVTSFAKLLAARDVIAPLSLGLFGAWGMGKTYFMERLRERIDEFSGIDRVTEDGERVYCRRIAHISFNAWHYVDKNLWASLALRIFDGLAEELGGKQELPAWRQLRARVESSEKRKKRAEERRAAAQVELAEAQTELRQTRAMHFRKEHQLFEQLREALPVDETLARISHDTKALGADEQVESIEDLRRIFERLQVAKSRSERIVAALVDLFSEPSRVLACAVLLALIVLAGYLVQSYANLAAGIGTQVVAAFSAGSVWVAKRVKSFSESTAHLDDLLGRIENYLVDEEQLVDEEKQRKLKNTLEDIDAIEAKIGGLRERKQQADKAIAEAENEILRIKSGGLVYDFLDERSHNPDYLKELGLISTIREDLGQLATLLEEWSTAVAPDANGADDSDSERRRPAKDAKPPAGDEATPPIDRIILYIDDLDRCDRDRVVKVLQAVHLLLAFPLFIVVVGVDPRWLEDSLEVVYKPEGPTGFSPQQYLEKIFQIPFTLPAMTPMGFEQLVDDLIETESESRRDGEAGVSKEHKAQSEGGDDSQPDSQAAEAQAAEQRPAAPQRPSQQEDSNVSVLLTAPEEEFLKKLHGFTGTPRLVKRMINVYRLLRVRAADPAFIAYRQESDRRDYDFDRFLGDDDRRGEFHQVMVLLALNVGTPHLGSSILRRIMDKEKQESSTVKKIIEELKQIKGSGDGDSGSELPAQRERALNRLESLIDEGSVPDDLSAYLAWAPEVGRYSFYWHQSAYDPIKQVTGT